MQLHDAILDGVTVEWSEGTCIVQLRAFFDQTQAAEPIELHFTRVSSVCVPRNAPWGESVYVNSTRAEGSRYVLEMQSGDEIEVIAGGVSLWRPPSTSV